MNMIILDRPSDVLEVFFSLEVNFPAFFFDCDLGGKILMRLVGLQWTETDGDVLLEYIG